ncbi:MAG: diaminopimelate decarboxylase [Dysgonamonadaceae bacterium]|nr:diaminopimelate decarboxylase [Dysgonamonadaceae bacterium]MDD4728587.1 diaminopimelate decarboxylase [Dysgonamonadaceae bacterium]
MIKGKFPIHKFNSIETPFYYYDVNLLQQTINTIQSEIKDKPYHVHYALKANSNPRILQEISGKGFGADCVSGNEILRAIENNFDSNQIAFAGIGKTDKEIEIALKNDIFTFNVESIPEMHAINSLAQTENKKARIALRINPNIDAHTHSYITTGLDDNKFGLDEKQIPEILALLPSLSSLKLIGVHFHIGSQITNLSSFKNLCYKINEIQKEFDNTGYILEHINVGGGLGVDYEQPNEFPIANFKDYFNLFSTHLELRKKQTLHFELGRSVVAQCGSLITRVTYLKKGIKKNFLIVDAGMTDLIRPALYQATHHIENLTSNQEALDYDIVGPICESSDIFAKDFKLNKSKRGDILAIRSAGAYGEVMASQYNCRDFAKSFFSDTI